MCSLSFITAATIRCLDSTPTPHGWRSFWTFGTAGTILLIIMAFSDTIQYRAGGGPVKSASMPVISEGGNRDNTQKKDYTQMEGRTVAGTRAEISGVDGKYAGASFDVSDGAEVVFGRSAADSNIVFDQFDTDISRKAAPCA